MQKKVTESDEDIAQRSLRYTKEQFEEIFSQAERYIRQNPGQALLYAFVAGYVLNRLPLGRIVSGLLRLSILGLKPAVLIYGATKIYEAAQEE
jgi:hypothetical protein